MTIYFNPLLSFFKYVKANSKRVCKITDLVTLLEGTELIFLICLLFDSWSFVQIMLFLPLFSLALCMRQRHQCLDYLSVRFIWGCCINECTFNKCKLCFHYFIKNILKIFHNDRSLVLVTVCVFLLLNVMLDREKDSLFQQVLTSVSMSTRNPHSPVQSAIL